MTRTELDRLRAEHDVAFQRKQYAYQLMQAAWDRRLTARKALNSAHHAKQHAYAEQDRIWKDYQRTRSSNGPLIDHLNARQESAFQSMKQAFGNASAAHDRRDGASASSYALEGHRCKAEAQGYVVERRRLVEEIRLARVAHESNKPIFQRAKDDYAAKKRTFDSAKAEYEYRHANFKRAMEVFDSASKAFRAQQKEVKAKSEKLKVGS